ncbi:4Fe-4S dicluster domain-containing protein [Eggerthella timonensis]|uniref:4Fe-4S dicluster domain-containing protein n=1 Tax=Eggerthella timonensis TaxID=1871008 RepID=UPI000C773569|nr:4Fe-4S dicluster domain-containing protein [Eggerthella timonensis]
MAVKRVDLNACIGCGTCAKICPMDVMRFDKESMKSVIAYVENCQCCAQCYLYCPSGSLGFDPATYLYAPAVGVR